VSRSSRSPDGDESGQTMLLIVGLAVVLMMAVAMVVNVSAAYLQRQGLDNLADGAALAGADAGAEGDDVYSGGLGDERLALFERTAREAVDDYLASTGASREFPGLQRLVTVDPDTQSVRVQISAPMRLPLSLPGTPDSATVSATGAAAVSPDP
jgi:Putative Flp pilus-assembly TadE/G-like